MTGDRHVRFWESGRGKLPPATRQAFNRHGQAIYICVAVDGVPETFDVVPMTPAPAGVLEAFGQ